MSFLKSIAAFIISLALTIFIYNYISIPIVPAMAIHCCALLFADDKYKFRYFLVVILAIVGVYLYGFNVYYSIAFYPQYRTIIGIIIDIANIFSIIGAAMLFYPKKRI